MRHDKVRSRASENKMPPPPILSACPSRHRHCPYRADTRPVQCPSNAAFPADSTARGTMGFADSGVLGRTLFRGSSLDFAVG